MQVYDKIAHEFSISTMFTRIFSLLIFLSIAGFGQNHTVSTTEVIWSENPTCSEQNSDRIKAALPACGQIKTEQGTFYRITYRNLSYAIRWVDLYDYIRVSVQIVNNQGNGVTIDPMLSTIMVFKDQKEFESGKKAKIVKAITGQRAKDLMEVRISDSNRDDLSPVGTNTAVKAKTGQTAETRRMIVLEPQPPKAQPPKAGSQRVSVSGSKLEKSIFKSSLLKQSIPDQKQVAGYVFFNPIKDSAKYKVFRMHTDEITFTFPQIENKRRPLNIVVKQH